MYILNQWNETNIINSTKIRELPHVLSCPMQYYPAWYFPGWILQLLNIIPYYFKGNFTFHIQINGQLSTDLLCLITFYSWILLSPCSFFPQMMVKAWGVIREHKLLHGECWLEQRQDLELKLCKCKSKVSLGSYKKGDIWSAEKFGQGQNV